MSELTTCNYCNHQRVLRKAKEKKMVVSLLPSKFMGGVQVYMHPANVDVRKLTGKSLAWFEAGIWYMQLPNHCCC